VCSAPIFDVDIRIVSRTPAEAATAWASSCGASALGLREAPRQIWSKRRFRISRDAPSLARIHAPSPDSRHLSDAQGPTVWNSATPARARWRRARRKRAIARHGPVRWSLPCFLSTQTSLRCTLRLLPVRAEPPVRTRFGRKPSLTRTLSALSSDAVSNQAWRLRRVLGAAPLSIVQCARSPQGAEHTAPPLCIARSAVAKAFFVGKRP